jgi:hypothetical protein
MDATFPLPQCTDLRARESFQFTNPRTNRTVMITAGTVLWVSSTQVEQSAKSAVMLCRKNQPMGTGWYFSPHTMLHHFEVVR